MVCFPIQANGESHEYRIDLSKNPLWKGETITAIRIDPGDWEHGKPRSGKFAIDCVRAGNLPFFLTPARETTPRQSPQ